MDGHPNRRSGRVVVALVISGLVIAAGVVGASYLGRPTANTLTSTSTSLTTAPGSQSTQGSQSYVSLPLLYSSLGFPKLTYSSNEKYLPSLPNFTYSYQTNHTSFQLGSVQTPVIGLDQAVELAAEYMNLSPSNYSLVAADFEPGSVVNGTLLSHPSWGLSFARSYDGYWIWGDYGTGETSVFVDVDAVNGSIGDHAMDLSSLPSSGTYRLDTNASLALQAVRAADISGVPAALTGSGTVVSNIPEIVLLGPSSNNAAFQAPLDASLSGQKVLCWISQLTSPSPDYGYQGTFAVDAQTGALVSGWAQNLYPNTLEEYVSDAVDFSHVEGFSVVSETFLVNGSVLGMPGSVPVVVPDVVVLEPGSSGSIGFNFSSTLQRDASERLSFENPLPAIQTLASSGRPQGVNVTFSGQPFTVPNNGSAESTISIAVASDAPSGTFLIELTASQSGTQVGESGVLFLMTVWNGTGTWPLPPTVA